MSPEPPPLSSKKPLWPGVILAFVPTTLALLLLIIRPAGKNLAICCVVAAVLSIICCFLSSFLLIRRDVPAALVLGILLFVLNLFMSAGLGCAALSSSNDMH